MAAVEVGRGITCVSKRTSTRNLVVFLLSEQVFGLPVEGVQEVVPLPLLSRPANAPKVLAGFFNLAGTAVAVIRMDRLLATGDRAPALYSPLLVTRSWGFPAALLVDEVLGMAAVPEHAILPVDRCCSLNGCTEGMAPWGERRIVVLSPPRIVFEAERQMLAGLAAHESERLAAMQEASPRKRSPSHRRP